jgi:uncharacterized protein DUF4129
VPVRPSVLRPALLAAAILVLLALVAVASRSDRPARPADLETRALPAAFWDYLLSFAVLVTIVVLALVVYLRVPLRRSSKRGRFTIIHVLALAIIVSFVAFAGTRPEWRDIRVSSGAEEGSDQGSEMTAPQGEESGRDSRPIRIRWEVFLAAGGLLVVGGIYAARKRSNLRRGVEDPDAAAALSSALDESVDDLRAERDGRRAVIAAYARMEQTLNGHGFPRFRAEAPLEYLSRVLRALRVRSEAVLALTELFERAKFSRHEIDAEMKEEAIGALIAVRDDLRA